jgi:hypothetical protein
MPLHLSRQHSSFARPLSEMALPPPRQEECLGDWEMFLGAALLIPLPVCASYCPLLLVLFDAALLAALSIMFKSVTER